MIRDFEDWVFDASRVDGEVDVIETDYGVHIMYYVDAEGEQWFFEVVATMIAEALDANLNSAREAYTATVFDACWEQIVL